MITNLKRSFYRDYYFQIMKKRPLSVNIYGWEMTLFIMVWLMEEDCIFSSTASLVLYSRAYHFLQPANTSLNCGFIADTNYRKGEPVSK